MRKLTLVSVALCVLAQLPATASIVKKSATCPTTMANCPPQGCSTDHDVDGDLNKLKNTLPTDSKPQGTSEPKTLQWMKKLPSPAPETFVMGGSRKSFQDVGEGKKIQVTALLLVAKRESGESCNCELNDDKLPETAKDTAVNTDNHLVLVSPETVTKFPIPNNAKPVDVTQVFNNREKESITVEFTPRVRAKGHPNFVRAKIQSLIHDAPEQALPVRVTGMLMFDSQHLIENPLVRVNNWEIHPILKLEFCPNGKTCSPDKDAGWVSLDDL